MEHVNNFRIGPLEERGEMLTVQVDGKPVTAYAGETVAAVLLAIGKRVFRHTDKKGEPRGIFCNQGVCYECLVTINGEMSVRACMTSVQPDMVIETEGATHE
jgi:predicted molibdopterin-dependent oxidoreductase YjgC